MKVRSLEELLEELSSGDAQAAERAFISYEPYLRKVVRRLLPVQLRAKFDSIDVVQSVYGDVISAFRGGRVRFGSVAELRAFLVRATRNRFIDRVRQHRTALRLERPLHSAVAVTNGHSHQPRPSETAAAQEMWERLLALCPPEHHRLLVMRRGGSTAGEIAKETGMHEGSVRRVLRELSMRLALETCSDTAESK